MVNKRHPVVERHRIKLPARLRGLSGLTIAHLTDIHAGPSMRGPALRRLVEEVNSLGADFIAVTGDIMNWQRKYLAEVVETFQHLSARLGTFAVLGNHDFYFGAGNLIRALHDATPLRFIGKQRLVFEEAPGLTVTGHDDPMVSLTKDHDYPDLEHLSQENHPDHFHVLLTHRPDAFHAATRHGYDLVLAGHTHGGQVNLTTRRGRRINISKLATPFDAGFYTNGRTRLYVSRGLGYTAVPFRMNCPPEIALFTLEAA